MSDLIIFLPNQQKHSRRKTSCVQCFPSFIAYGQALQSALEVGRQKEGELATKSLKFEYLHWKVDAKGWLAEMTLVMTSLPLTHVFQCSFALVSPPRWLAEIWQLCRRGATGKLEVESKFQRRSCKLSFLFPPHRKSVLASLLAGNWFHRNRYKLNYAHASLPHL